MVLIGSGPGRSWGSLDKAHQTLVSLASVAIVRPFLTRNPRDCHGGQPAPRKWIHEVDPRDGGRGSRRARHMLGLPTVGGTASSTGGGIPPGPVPPNGPLTVGSAMGMRGVFSTSFSVWSSDMSGD